MLTLQETRSIQDSKTFQKLNLLLIFTLYYNYLKYKKNIFDLRIKTVLHLNIIVLTVQLECKMEKRNSQLEHGQPMEQTSGLFCTCNSRVARCQSRHQYHL